MPEDRLGHGRLDSWKEIAAYLNRDVRTVIRWEEKGLPVRRVPGGKRQTVFAFPAEIDAWLMSQKNSEAKKGTLTAYNGHGTAVPHRSAAAELDEGSPDPSVDAPGLKPAFFHRFYAALKGRSSTLPQKRSSMLANQGRSPTLLLGAAVLLAVIAVAMLFPHPRAVSAVYPLRLTQLTHDGRQKMNLGASGDFIFFNEFQGDRELLAGVPVQGGSIFTIPTPFENVDLQDVQDGSSVFALPYQGTEYERPLWYISAQSGDPGRIGNFQCHAARRSPDHRWIACASGTRIELYSSDAQHGRTLASLRSAIINLEWSTDSRNLLFSLRDDTSSTLSLWKVPVDDDPEHPAVPVKLSLSGHCCFSWTWLNGGGDFVYIKAGEDNQPVLFTKPEDGSASLSAIESELPVKIGTPTALAASTDGSRLYLLIQGTWESEMLRYDSKQKAFQTFAPGLSASYLSFSPDGQWMSYVDENQALWRSRVDGSDALRLAKDMEYVELSSWSPDGRKIAFMGLKPGKPWRIFTVDRDGGEPQEASNGDDNQGAPTWSFDGRKIAYASVNCNETQTCWVNMIDVATKSVERLPGSHGFRTARWSPDGKYIAALVPEAHELMLFDVANGRWRKMAGAVTGDTIGWSRDSRFVYADSPQGEKPVIERFRVRDSQRSTAASLADLQKIPGQMDFWFGITPDNSLIVVHHYTASEVYAMDWAERPSR